MGGGINRPMPDCRARWVLAEIVLTSPIRRWSDGPWLEAAAAIGADIVQHVRDACRAKRTFVRADARLG